MPVEQREQVTHITWSQRATGGTPGWWKAAAFTGWHEPDESRDSRPDPWGARGEIPRAYSARADDVMVDLNAHEAGNGG